MRRDQLLKREEPLNSETNKETVVYLGTNRFFFKIFMKNRNSTKIQIKTGVSHLASIRGLVCIEFKSMGHMTDKLLKRNAEFSL